MSDVATRNLAECEQVIERGLATFVEVGQALAAIRDERLYLGAGGFTTFEDYCQERWDLGRSRAYQMIEAAEVVQHVGQGNAPVPASDRVARELTPVMRREPAQVAEVWERVTTEHGPKPTAREVREVVQTFTQSGGTTPPEPRFTCCPTCGQRVRADRPLNGGKST